jgi:hypothetical protein
MICSRRGAEGAEGLYPLANAFRYRGAGLCGRFRAFAATSTPLRGALLAPCMGRRFPLGAAASKAVHWEAAGGRLGARLNR